MTNKLFSFLLILFFQIEASEIAEENLKLHSYLVLVITLVNKTQITSRCSGCIISSNLILTTAQCYKSNEKSIAVLGAATSGDKSVEIQKWILHPFFSCIKGIFYNEVAVVKTDIMKIENASPVEIQSLPSDPLMHVRNCKMVGWKLADLADVQSNYKPPNSDELGQTLSTVYTVNKTVHLLTQCDALIELVEKELVLDDSFICIQHDKQFIEDPQFGLLGSPLFCQMDKHSDRWILIGLKRKQRDVITESPELYINIHSYGKYLQKLINNSDSEPIIYFCQIRVCGKKYKIHGEYCVVGDKVDCIHLNRTNKSKENSRTITASLTSISLILYLNHNFYNIRIYY
ncbi:hypothetical protein WA026_016171 [Henosepilachna vigintioctopunctata]|uniref:Peptidase S1 domain-containing protein n=1 Tax=Henosepilachna vigintioctopunctata TaxID=420089 RepID=A0AAW1TWC2_9CUCU